jgi:hypothetical protein
MCNGKALTLCLAAILLLGLVDHGRAVTTRTVVYTAAHTSTESLDPDEWFTMTRGKVFLKITLYDDRPDGERDWSTATVQIVGKDATVDYYDNVLLEPKGKAVYTVEKEFKRVTVAGHYQVNVSSSLSGWKVEVSQ